ncbi:MAG: YeeE/YedE family protein [Burkholderiaceae bacterium]
MKTIASLMSGMVFGLGLLISGMANPAKVQNFLDLMGTWDPSLAFVMGGAIAVTLPGFILLRRRVGPLFHDVFHFPTATDVDVPLLTGAAIFGVGWGLGGFCPGPALTALPMGNTGTYVFVAFMLFGMMLARWYRSLKIEPGSARASA